MQTVTIVNLWHIFALLRYQTSNGRDRALNWMLLVEFTAWVHSNAQEIAVHVAIIDFLQVWTTGKKIARPDDVTVKIRNQQHEQVPGVSKCANATRHLKSFANKLLKQKHLCVTDRSTCCAVWQKAEFQFAFSKCFGSLAWHFSRILGQKSKATIPPKSYASRFLRHFSQHVIEVDEVGHSNNLDGLGGNRGKRPWFWFLMTCWSYISFIQFLESRNVFEKSSFQLITPSRSRQSLIHWTFLRCAKLVFYSTPREDGKEVDKTGVRSFGEGSSTCQTHTQTQAVMDAFDRLAIAWMVFTRQT